MSEKLGLEDSAPIDGVAELRNILDEQQTTDTIMKDVPSEPPQLDISTTTAAIAAAQVAQLQKTDNRKGQQCPRGESEPSAMSIANAIREPPPIPAPLQNIRHRQSPVPGQSPDLDSGSHDLRSPPFTELPPPTPTQICLCQQPARIPRPRNAFILFRQHNHAQVVQANPGKPNPEISKIIGEMWRQSSKETKAVWQRYADDEKRKHLLRYPEYKYQPRRNGKKGTQAAGSGGMAMSESAICKVCGGHTGALNTPETPSTPMSATPVSAVSKTFRNTYMPTPRTPSSAFGPMSPIPRATRRKRGEDDSRPGVDALLQLGIQDEDGELSPVEPGIQAAPGAKKRRLNATSPTSSTDVSAAALQTPRTSVSMGFGHHQNIDPFLKHPGAHDCSYGEHEPSAVVGGEPELGSPFSTADVLKGISAIQKLQAIGTICKPLPAPEATPGAPPRGAIIALEGEDPAAVTALCDSLAETLKGERVEIISVADEFEAGSWRPGGLHFTVTNNNGEGSDTRTLSTLESDEDIDEDSRRTAKYLQALADWRSLSNKMRKKVLASTGCSQATDRNGDSEPPQQRPHAATSIQLGRFPILLVNRYILSRTDCAVSKLPSDGLTPTQHWQWAASVWKGCVGADMTILVKTDGPQRGDGVEVKVPGRVLIARRDVGKEWDGGRVRRLGFEVNECVRTLMGANT